MQEPKEKQVLDALKILEYAKVPYGVFSCLSCGSWFISVHRRLILKMVVVLFPEGYYLPPL